jgi:hypothetical protein
MEPTIEATMYVALCTREKFFWALEKDEFRKRETFSE